jgi:iron complex transport system substrate-binding protein
MPPYRALGLRETCVFLFLILSARALGFFILHHKGVKKMNKKLLSVLIGVLLVAGAALTGCGGGNEAGGGGGSQTPPDGAYPMTIVDDLGREVTLEARPERIVSLIPSLTEILFALDAGDRVVGVTNWCNYPAETADREKVGDLFSPNTEVILALQPDLILTGRSEMLDQTLGFLEENGIPYIVVDPQDMDEIEASIAQVAKIIGSPEKAAAILADIQEGREHMAEKVADKDRPNVFVLLDTEYLYTVGSGEFLSDMIQLAGGNNEAANLGTGYFQLSEEAFFELDPDIIICTFPMSEQVLAKSNWQELKAVKNGRVYDVNGDLVSRPGPRVILGLEELYGVFY